MFNFLFFYCLVYMVLGLFIIICFVIGGVGVWYLCKGMYVEVGCCMLIVVVVFVVLIVLV